MVFLSNAYKPIFFMTIFTKMASKIFNFKSDVILSFFTNKTFKKNI